MCFLAGGKFFPIFLHKVFWYIIAMEDLLEIIRKRRPPGILILDADNRLLYSNKEVLALLPNLLAPDSRGKARTNIPAEILKLCSLMHGAPADDGSTPPRNVEFDCSFMVDGAAQFFSVRAFSISGYGPDKGVGYIMVLLEEVVEKHSYDFEKIRKTYNFSAREMDVLCELCQGLSNRHIAEKLFISEYTVKDHLKSIMEKMRVDSRNEIVAALR